MITPMRHVTLIVRAQDNEALLAELGALGLVHLAPRPAGGEAVEHSRQRLADVSRLIQRLEAMEVAPREATADVDGLLARSARLEDHHRQVKHLEAKLVRELRAWESFGEVEPETVRALRAGGLRVCFCRGVGAEKHADAVWLPTRPGYGVMVGLHQDCGAHGGDCVALPVRGPRRIRGHLANLHALEDKYHREQVGMAAALPSLRAEKERLGNELEFLLAREGMEGDGTLRWIEGFIPEERADDLGRVAEAAGAAVVLRAPRESDPTPTLLKQNAVVSWIRPVYDFLGVTPGYTEVDVGWSFLLFLGLFSGMIIGDAGYGFLLIALVAGLNLLKPGTRGRFANLLLLMGGATLVWGLLTGNVFGMGEPPFGLVALRVPALTETQPLMRVCFVLGALHLTLAHAWNFVRKVRTPQCLAELGWIGSTWCMYFITGMMVLNEPLPVWVPGAFAASAGLIVVFMTPPRKFKEDWVQHMMLPLSFVNNFVDVVSYVRLYAVGMAGLALSQSFNAMILGTEGGPARGLLATAVSMLVLVLMHGLNFILAGLGVMVHGIRLNTLEFASHIGLTWSGIPYKPFRAESPPPLVASPLNTEP